MKSVLDIMEEETQRATQKTGAFKPTFLLLKDGQKAMIRPLFNLDGVVVMRMHNKYNQGDVKQSINAVCAAEMGQSCVYCADAENDKKLRSAVSFLLPVWVHRIAQKDETGKWADLTYQDQDGKQQPVYGLRVLELKAFGTISAVFQTLRSLHTEDEQHDVTRMDLIIERKGAGQQTSYVVLPKAPSSMHPLAKDARPTVDTVREMVLAACPSKVSGAAANGTNGHSNGTVADLGNLDMAWELTPDGPPVF